MTHAPRFTLRQLEILISVAEHSSVTRAADQLCRTQPAVTRAIQEMEIEVGNPLFDRAPRGMSLTVFGEAILRHAKAIMAELRQASEELDALQGKRTGSLLIGTTPFGAAGCVPDALLRMTIEYPEIDISVVEENYGSLLAMLCSGELDVVIGPAVEGVLDPQLESQDLIDDDLVLVAGSANTVCIDAGLGELTQHKWVLPQRGNGLWREIIAFFDAAGIEAPRKAIKTNSMAVLRSLVRSGGFLTVLPRQIVAPELQLRDMVEIASVPHAKWRLLMLTRKTKFASPALNAMRAVIHRLTRGDEGDFAGAMKIFDVNDAKCNSISGAPHA